jgi:hypothetical protein
MTICDVNGRGRAKKPLRVGRGAVRCVPKIGSRTKIENLIPNFLVDQIVNDVLSIISNGLHQTEKYLYSMSSKQAIEEPKTGNSVIECIKYITRLTNSQFNCA